MAHLATNGGTPVRTASYPSWPISDEREKKALLEVLESGKWWYGEKVHQFEQAFADFHEAKYGVAVANGTVALEIALKAAGVKAGDEVIVPPYTFIATASSVLNIGAIPVFADIEAATLNIDPDSVRQVITPRTKAIVPVHIGGNPADMDGILAVAKDFDLKVIEDAAQAHGAEWRGKKVGALGTAGTFSFQVSKNMASAEGGILVTNDAELAELAWAYHNVGRMRSSEWYEHPVLGTNFRLTEMAAALLLVQLERLEEQMAKRDANVRYLFEQVSQIEGLRPIDIDPRATRSSWHVVKFQYDPAAFANVTKTQLCKALQAEGIPAGAGYTEPLYSQKVFQRIEETAPAAYLASGNTLSYKKVRCPVAEQAGATTIGFAHQVFLAEKADMDDIVAGFKKVQAYADEITK